MYDFLETGRADMRKIEYIRIFKALILTLRSEFPSFPAMDLNYKLMWFRRR